MRIKIKLPKNVGYILQNAYDVHATNKEIVIKSLEFLDSKKEQYKINETKYLAEDIKGIDIEFIGIK